MALFQTSPLVQVFQEPFQEPVAPQVPMKGFLRWDEWLDFEDFMGLPYSKNTDLLVPVTRLPDVVDVVGGFRIFQRCGK